MTSPAPGYQKQPEGVSIKSTADHRRGPALAKAMARR
jgi:hypothetical protein